MKSDGSSRRESGRHFSEGKEGSMLTVFMVVIVLLNNTKQSLK